MSRPASMLVVILAFAGLSGCVTTSDGPAPEQIASGAVKSHAVVIADIQFAGRKKSCGRPSMVLLRVSGETKVSGGRIDGASYYFGGLSSAPVPATLVPGRYWIVSVECPATPKLAMRSKSTGWVFRADNIVGAIATFDVAPGEVVSLGTINVYMGTRNVSIGDSLDEEVSALFRKDHPDLAARIIHRRPRKGSI